MSILQSGNKNVYKQLLPILNIIKNPNGYIAPLLTIPILLVSGYVSNPRENYTLARLYPQSIEVKLV